jgi:formylmethanofuran dehydrogenase subunit A
LLKFTKIKTLIWLVFWRREPIVDPSQYEVMKTNFVVTKAMSDEELEAIEAYVYSNLK